MSKDKLLLELVRLEEQPSMQNENKNTAQNITRRKRLYELVLLCRKMVRILSLVRKKRKMGIKVVLFMAPFFTAERLNDGYFKRVQAVDQLMEENVLRIYASWIDADYSNRRLKCMIHDKNHIEISFPHPQRFCDAAISLLAEAVDLVYYHSVTFAMQQLSSNRKNMLIVDLHGAYPEEERMYGRDEQADLDEKQEKIALENANVIVCVSRAMEAYYKSKYSCAEASFILLPIFDSYAVESHQINKFDTARKPVIVYAGGMQKWQRPEHMAETIRKVQNMVEFRIFTAQKNEFLSLWNGAQLPADLRLETKERAELHEEYQGCDYGLLLRENSVVNRVACPTKLIEYLEYDIIPILESEQVGDFAAMGMKYLAVEELKKGKFPTAEERKAMILQNRSVLQELKKIQAGGKAELKYFFDNYK